MAEPILSFDQVTILQEGVPTLQNVSFQLNPGDFAYLVGKSGSGKSTLFRAIFSELPIEIGMASVAGFNLNQIQKKEVPFLRRKLGFVFQDFQLLTDRNVEKNLSFVLEATGHTNKAEINTKIEEVLAKVGMSNAIHKKIHKLSGGEQQRISIARALLNNPVLILADEPTGHLDPEVSKEILMLFKELNQQGTTLLIASHDYSTIRQFPGRYFKCENNTIQEIAGV
ncbi:ATP-binding cassette domain-containing protein [Sandaracinomonas limnophila]|uniref:ATP-binding cassette domain-containing protein n=1 Tax=Sandaracinomonas limnophila TaxID=1862386 RepID=A0A437PQW3_9BACT|nr:ATP-binding cassette domain-containing protein [Sandaracinomonas limnophila]RVU24636.1 ATP-binding cassette domain-containing protein [Sandaracinomonas limnophila]